MSSYVSYMCFFHEFLASAYKNEVTPHCPTCFKWFVNKKRGQPAWGVLSTMPQHGEVGMEGMSYNSYLPDFLPCLPGCDLQGWAEISIWQRGSLLEHSLKPSTIYISTDNVCKAESQRGLGQSKNNRLHQFCRTVYSEFQREQDKPQAWEREKSSSFLSYLEVQCFLQHWEHCTPFSVGLLHKARQDGCRAGSALARVGSQKRVVLCLRQLDTSSALLDWQALIPVGGSEIHLPSAFQAPKLNLQTHSYIRSCLAKCCRNSTMHLKLGHTQGWLWARPGWSHHVWAALAVSGHP